MPLLLLSPYQALTILVVASFPGLSSQAFHTTSDKSLGSSLVPRLPNFFDCNEKLEKSGNEATWEDKPGSKAILVVSYQSKALLGGHTCMCIH